MTAHRVATADGAEHPLFVLVAAEPTEEEHADRGEAGGHDERHEPTARSVEVAERSGARGQRDEHEPRQHDDRARVDAHLEPFGLERVQQLEVAGRGVDEIFEDVADDRTAALVREEQHLEHPIAGRIRELLLDQLQRGTRAEHARQLGKAGERLAQRNRPGRRERVHRLRQRPAGGDRRDDVAEPVGPRGLHLAHPQPAAAGEVAARKQRDRDRRNQRDEDRAGQRDEDQEREQSGRGASRARTGSASARRRPAGATTGCARAAARTPARGSCNIGQRSHERAGDERAERADRRTPRGRSSRHPSVLEQAPETGAFGQDPVDALLERRRQHAGPFERPPEPVAHEERLVRLAVARLGTTAAISVTWRRT